MSITLATNYDGLKSAIPVVAGVWAILNAGVFLVLLRVLLPHAARRLIGKAPLWAILAFVCFAAGWYPLLDALNLLSAPTIVLGCHMGGSLALGIALALATRNVRGIIWPLVAGVVSAIAFLAFLGDSGNSFAAIFVPAGVWHLITGIGLRLWLDHVLASAAHHNAGKCPACQYDCRGLPGTLCPECGSNLATDESAPRVQ